MTSIRRSLGLPFLPVVLAPFLLLSPLWAAGKALFWGTPSLQFVPWWFSAWSALRTGHLPLWNPSSGMGAPLLANYQAGLLYPPNWLYFLAAALGGLQGIAWLQALLVAVHLAWAGAGMALLARRIGLNVLAQTVSGLAFGLCGYLVARSGFLSINAAAAWLPWILLFLTPAAAEPASAGWRQDQPAGRFFGLTACLALQLLAGHAQLTWYTWLLGGLWAGYWALAGARQAAAQDDGRFLSFAARGLGRAFARLALAILLAAALAAVQLLPTVEYLRQSQRAAAVEYDFAMTYSTWPWRFLGLLAPNLFGNPAQGDYWGYGNYWEDAAYIGLLPLFLALAALIAALFKRKKDAKFQPSFALILSGLALLSAFLALGKNTPLFPWLYRHAPSFAMFQAPARFLLWAEFALALLAGLGAQNWRRPQKRALYWTRLGTAGALSVSAAAGLAWFLMGKGSLGNLDFGQMRPTFIPALALAGLWAFGAGILSLLAPPVNKDDSAETNLAPHKLRLWQWAVVAWVLADLLVAGWGLNPGVRLDFYSQPSANAGELRARLGDGRLYLPPQDEEALKFKIWFRFESFNPSLDWSGLRSSLLPNLNLLDGLPSANNFDPLLSGRYTRWMEALDSLPASRQMELLELMGVRAVEKLQDGQTGAVRFDWLTSQGEQPGSPARLRWLPCAQLATSAEEAWAMVQEPAFDFSQEVILEGVSNPPLSGVEPGCQPAAQSGADSLSLEESGPNRVVAYVNASQSGWLLLADVWYPGWQARLDGQSVSLLRGDHLFRAVAVPAGSHRVEVVYRPLSFRLGALVSLLALLSVGLAWRLRGRLAC